MRTGTTPHPVSPVDRLPRPGNGGAAAGRIHTLPPLEPLARPPADQPGSRPAPPPAPVRPGQVEPAGSPVLPLPPAARGSRPHDPPLPLRPAPPARRSCRSLTGIAQLSTPDLLHLLSRALDHYAALVGTTGDTGVDLAAAGAVTGSATGAPDSRGGDRAGTGHQPPSLQGRRVVTVFYENSTRTAQSFHLAAHRLGVAAFDLPVSRSSVQKGESLRDTLRTCQALGFDAVILRHPVTGAAAYAASVLDVPVINAGDGTGEHPTQALLDAVTILTRKGWPAGFKVAIVGDVRHSRVARSAALLLSRLGAEVWLCGPPGLLPAAPPCPGVKLTPSRDAALDGADVVMALRIQRERLAGVVPDLGEYRRAWGIGPRELERARPDAILMHPGPVNRGVELDPAVMDDPRCVIEDQVRFGVAARMAVLEWALDPALPDSSAVAAAEPAGAEHPAGAGFVPGGETMTREEGH
ncbi:aspartate carbamoyltransferase catalytic subunit [Thermaerobacter sp. PB12/4term]|uniref:aspartate carbamoyltransferase catalytic subunit n=1 Tax=Thermaerobacter sp. PB12/4term TaxID=2293838 RepID=UPI000E327D98|nr:aspartate carbamoyltransferase catalytic subunit [Thermaerobacter sp. PB12/4term]QIA27832.1 aspartate carbamoyltransferase catalytic subunit [Thermaerobacter sp. PB12/4term]